MKRIILADDHSFVRVGLAQILRDEFPSAEIMEVSDGETLIREALMKEWELVITDLDMPGRSGIEALEQIKQVKPELPVIVLSIYPDELYAVRVFKAGASAYLNKNAAPEELIDAINRVSLGRKYITPEIAEQLLQFGEDKKPHEYLSNREFEIFKLFARGRTVSQIADALSLAPTTVSTHRRKIFQKLNLTTPAELTRYAIANQIISDISK